MTDFNQKTHDTDVGCHGGQPRQMMEVFENQEFGSIRVLQEAGTALPKRKHKPNTTRKGLPGMGRPFLCVYDLTWITLEGKSISAFPCT